MDDRIPGRWYSGKLLFTIVCLNVLLCFSFSNAAAQTIWYVKASTGSDTNGGDSWATAFSTITKALSVSATSDQIWVSEGTYKPGTGTLVTETFTLKPGVQLYGGFSGNESSLSQRTDWRAHPTILDGGLKSYHVLTGVSLGSNAILDGFTIANGNARYNTSTSHANNYGAGLYLTGTAPQLRNLIFKDNKANFYGAGLYNTGAGLILQEVEFIGNQVTYNTSSLGGAMYNTGTNVRLDRVLFEDNTSSGSGGGFYNGGSGLEIKQSSFRNNRAVSGGGMYSATTAAFDRTEFVNNTASGHGGALYNTGNAQISNSVFSRNRNTTASAASLGAGIFNGGGILTVTNSTFSNNAAAYVHATSQAGAAIYRNSGSINLYNSILWGNKRGNSVPDQILPTNLTVSNSIVEGAVTGKDVLIGDPRFLDADADDLRLSNGSLALDAGDNARVTGTEDLSGSTRIINGVVDLGAHEKAVHGGLKISTADFAPVSRGLALSRNFETDASGTGISWSVVAGVLPPGLHLDSSGVLSGVPLAEGTYDFVVRAENSTTSGDRQYRLAVDNSIARIYVSASAGSVANGSSWQNAFRDLLPALELARDGDEIWVGRGTYSPGNLASSAYTMVSGVKIYGGFAGVESTLSDRDTTKLYEANASILDGANVNQHLIFNNLSLSASTQLDGFVIIRGKTADGSSYTTANQGAAIYNASGVAAVFSNLEIRDHWSLGGALYNAGAARYRNLSFRGNTSKFDGAAIHNISASAVFSNIILDGNTSLRYGGAIYSAGSASFQGLEVRNNKAVIGAGIYTTVLNQFSDILFEGNIATSFGGGLYNIGASQLDRVIFRNNKGESGGGMYVESGNAVLRDVQFLNNIAVTTGGGLFYKSAGTLQKVSFIANSSAQHGAGMYNAGSSRLENVIFSRNTVTNVATNGYGAGFYNLSGNPTLVNTSFSANRTSYIHATTLTGAGLYRQSGTVTVYNSIFWGSQRGNNVPDQLAASGINVFNSIVEGGYTGTNIYLGDPLFTDSGADVLSLKPGSLAIDAGDNSRTTLPDDLAGNPRIINNVVDLGALENVINDGLLITTEDLPAHNRGLDFSKTFTSSGATSWSITAGAIPQGLTLNTSGNLSGIPIIAGVYEFVLTASNGAQVGSRQYRLEILEAPSRLYVNRAATGGNNGSTWQNAFTDLQSALQIARTDDEIWVAKGLYSPGTAPGSTFELVSTVKIYGGFAGTETNLSDRNAAEIHGANLTRLSGENRNYHVVSVNTGISASTLLDGFTISGGKTLTGTSGANYSGGGIYISHAGAAPVFNDLIITDNTAAYGAGVFNAGPSTFRKVKFINNTASTDGGGMQTNVAITLIDSEFRQNTAVGFGGGLTNVGNSTLSGVTFRSNSAGTGGGLYNGSGTIVLNQVLFQENTASATGGGMHAAGSPTFTDVQFIKNSSGTTGAGIYITGTGTFQRVSFLENTAVQHGGGAYFRSGTNRLENVVFSANRVTGPTYLGGGAYHYAGTTTLINTTFSGNQTVYATVSGAGLAARASGTITIQNSIFWGNMRANGTVPDQISSTLAVVNNSIVQDGYSGNNIRIGDPLFVNAAAHNLRLSNGSPAIDAGDNSVVTSTVDMDAEIRIVQDIVDLGAYENAGSGESVRVTQTSLSNPTRGTAYSQTMSATGGTGIYTWRLSSGNLPKGLRLSEAGSISGTPVLAGSYTFVITASDGTISGSRQFTVIVNSGNARLYVKQNAAGNNDGADWQNAFVDLTAAADISESGDEIWVAKGTYIPGTLATSSFSMKEGVKWYGGFAGSEAQLSNRDSSLIATQNETILSGSNKSYHVIFNNTALSNATVLDGFTVSGGKGLAGSTSANYLGGGIYNALASIAAEFKNLQVKNNSASYGGGIYNMGPASFSDILVSGNSTSNDGAGIYNSGAATFKNIRFHNNTATANGGGLWGSGTSTFTNTEFIQNKATNGGAAYQVSGAPAFFTSLVNTNTATGAGGGMYLGAGSTIKDATFRENTAGTTGGGLHGSAATNLDRVSFIRNTSATFGGGMYNVGISRIDNVVFSHNRVTTNSTSGYGGGLYNHSGASVITNSTFAGNSIAYQTAAATMYGGGFYSRTGTPQVYNSIFWNNARGNGVSDEIGGTIQVYSSVVKGGFATGTDIMIGDPIFTDEENDVLTLRPGSVAINAGDNARLSMTLDRDGNPRIVDDQVDMGAYESQVGGGLAISPTVLSDIVRGQPFSQQFIANGVTGPSTWSLQSGSLPAGLSFSSSGLLAGQAVLPGAYTFVLSVTDGVLVGNKQIRVNVVSGPARLYVNSSATGLNDGSSWLNAFNDLQSAFSNALSSDEIWVAKGTYSPGKAVSSTFTLKEGVRIYGGFSGTELTFSDRDLSQVNEQNTSILSGSNINYHVVSSPAGISNATVLDGFTISNGKTATGSSGASYSGAGLYNITGSPLLRNLVFRNNSAHYGGGLYNTGNLNLNNVRFYSNSSSSQGAGIYNAGTIKISDAVFDTNTSASTGAGIFNALNLEIHRASFLSNLSVSSGAAVYHSAGVLKVANSMFSANKVSSTSNVAGAAIYHNTGTSTLNNLSISRNQTSYVNAGNTAYGAGLFFRSGSMAVNNSILWGNYRGNNIPDQLNAGVTINYSIVQNGYEGGQQILIGDPLFEDAAAHDLRLKAGSAAIDAGENSRDTSSVDFLGSPRIVNDMIDLGAIENSGGGSISVQPFVLPSMSRGQAINISLIANGGNGDYIWDVQSGRLPAGLVLTRDGRIISTPTTPGSYTFVVSVSDGQLRGSRQYTVTVNEGAARIYVRKAATGANSGSDWENAYTELQTALAEARSGDEIWVAKGVYSPGSTNTSWFTLKDAVRIYGGFAGTEQALSERDSTLLKSTNQSILDGSAGVPSYHVVYNTAELSDQTLLDGFTIKGGVTASGTSGASYYGGGIYNTRGSAVFRNLWIRDNIAYYYGGGMYNSGNITLDQVHFENNRVSGSNGGGLYNTGQITISRSVFQANTATSNGGGMMTTATVVLSDTKFLNNSATNGGGLYTSAALSLADVDFEDNRVSGNGAGIWSGAAFNYTHGKLLSNVSSKNGGGIFNSGSSTFDRLLFAGNKAGNNGAGLYNSGLSVSITNTGFSNNQITSASTYYGAGIYNSSGTLTLSNLTFANNKIGYVNSGTLSYGAGLHMRSGTVNAYNSIFWGNHRGNSVADQLNANINLINSLVQGGYETGVNVYIGDPLFEDAAAHDLSLKAGSAAIDAGDDTKNVTSADLAGNPRVNNGTIDIGAFEFNGPGSMNIQPSSLPILIRGVSIDLPFEVAGSTLPILWSLQSGVLPPGLVIRSDGRLQGYPTIPGTYTFVVSASDGLSRGSRQLRVQVDAGPARLFVSSSAPGNNTGSSWTNAFTDFQTAITHSMAGDEIWVAAGQYSPGDKTSSRFTLKEGVKWYGGFAGTESTLADRDQSLIHTINETILDGSKGVNSYHVIYNTDPLTSATVVDGFTISGGKTIVNGTNYTYDSYTGAGLYNVNPANELVLRNLLFKLNRATNGGAIFTSGSPKLSNIRLEGNIADFGGGGMYITGTPTLDSVSISGNTALNGAGIFNSGTLVLKEASFSGNNASASGGALYSSGISVISEDIEVTGNSATVNGGGFYIHRGDVKLSDAEFRNNKAARSGGAIFFNSGTSVLDRVSFDSNTSVQHGGAMYNASSNPELLNSRFYNNSVTSTSSYYGGAVYSYSGTLTFRNATLTKNKIAYPNTGTPKYGGAIHTRSGTTRLFNSILWENSRGAGIEDELNSLVSIENSLVRGAGGIIHSDPWFKDAILGDLNLQVGSIAIDQGDNSKNISTLDIDSKPRLENDLIDLGAYETPAGPYLNIQPQSLAAMTRGVYVDIPLTLTQSQGDLHWAIAAGKLPTGLELSTDGHIRGIPVLAGFYEFIIQVADDSLRGTRRFRADVLNGKARLYVHASATGRNDGSNWANALTDLQSALAQAAEGDEIWVAKGVYSPGLKTSSSFVLKSGVKIYGGFAGTESDISQRDIVALAAQNETILDGSQGIASYHVVSNTTALADSTLLDGFTISGGRALTSTSSYATGSYVGAGLYDANAGSKLRIRNMHFKNNSANNGSALYSSGAISIEDSKFSANTAAYNGGAVYTLAEVQFRNLSFIGNEAKNGAGWYSAGNGKLVGGTFTGNNAILSGAGIYSQGLVMTLDSMRFENNVAAQYGAAIYSGRAVMDLNVGLFTGNRAGLQGGAVYINSGNGSRFDRLQFIGNTSGRHGGAFYNSSSTLQISNSLFVQNSVSSASAYYGGAVYNYSGALTLINNTFSRNSIAYVNSNAAISYGGAIYRRSGTVKLINSIVHSNIRANGVADEINAGILTQNSLIRGGYTNGELILNTDPLFADPANDDFGLQPCSPAVNMADNTQLFGTLDLAGNSRISSSVADLGAFESQGARLAISPASLAEGERGKLYTQQLQATGGTGSNYSFAITYGKLPDGLGISPDGLISGNPIVNGSFLFNVSVSDGTTCGNQLYQIDVIPGTGVVRIFVNAAAIGGMNNGSSWQNAYLGLQNALEVSIDGDEIWVAKGIYSPGNKAASTFKLKEGVKLFGGFSATEDSLSQRDTSLLRTTNASVLDGSEGVGSYHILSNTAELSNKTWIDGFTIRGANSSSAGSGTTNSFGAGLYSTLGSPVLQNLIFKNNVAYRGAAAYLGGAPTIRNVHFENNKVSNSGGALYLNGPGPFKISASSFVNNVALANGGAIYGSGSVIQIDSASFRGNKAEGSYSGGAIYATSAATLNEVTFVNNSAYQGGALYASNTTTIQRATFLNNSSRKYGGAVYLNSNSGISNSRFIGNTSFSHGGAIYKRGTLTLSNSIFSRNSVTTAGGNYGGAIFHYNGTSTVINSTFSNNRTSTANSSLSTQTGSASYRNSGVVNIWNSIFWGNTRANNVPDQLNAGHKVSNSLIRGGYTAAAIIVDADPVFVDAAQDDLRLSNCSPAINMGDNTLAVGIRSDLSGAIRVYGSTIDLGAYEDQSERVSITTDLPAGNRGQSFNQQLTTDKSGTYTWTIAYGKLPDGLLLLPSGLITGKPISLGVFHFNVSVSDGTICGNRLYQMEILPGTGTVRMYVNASATGMNNGANWENGFTDLQNALKLATTGDSIWVAKGTYSPGTTATSYFILKENVRIFGGFAATEESLNERDSSLLHTTNETILNGAAGTPSYHVIYNAAALSNGTILDGFTISGGKTASTSNTTSASYVGGGIYNANVAGSPTFRNLIIRGNTAVNGGGMYNTGSPILEKVKFIQNKATTAYGGGLYTSGIMVMNEVEFDSNTSASYGGAIYNAKGSLEVRNSVFRANIAANRGGALYTAGNTTLRNVTFSKNSVSTNQFGGAVFISSGTSNQIDGVSFIENSSGSNGGAIYNAGNTVLNNVIFSRNSVRYNGAAYGGGMYTSTGAVQLRNVTFSGNNIAYSNSSVTTSYGGGLHRLSGTVDIRNSIFWGNVRGGSRPDQLNGLNSVSNSLVQGDYKEGTLIVTADPAFRNAEQHDLSLDPCSPAINMGDNSAAGLSNVDIALQPRITNGTVDLGAYEFQGQTLQTGVQTLPLAKQWKAYNHTISVGDNGPYRFSLTTGQLPDGLLISPEGVLTGTPNSSGIYHFSLSVSGADACGTLQLSLEVEQQLPYIIQVYSPFPLPIDIKVGTPFEQIALPTTIEVLLSDQTKTSLGVIWTAGDYNKDVVGKYTILGTPVLTNPEQNPDSLRATIRASVFDPVTKYIVAVDTLPAVFVRSGTPFSELVLPQQVTVRYDTGETELLGISWKTGNYLPQAGLFRFYGDLILSDPESNPAAFEASVDVYAQRDIQSVETLSDKIVAINTPASSLSLPIMVRVTYHDLTTENLIVSWNSSFYNPAVAGAYDLEGNLSLKTGTINTGGLKAAIRVIIPRNIASVLPSTAISVPFATAFANVPFPDKASVTFDDGSEGTVEVSWLDGTYQAELEGIYTVSGLLSQEDGVGNSLNLFASIDVTVLPRPKNVVSVAGADTLKVSYGTDFVQLAARLPRQLATNFDDLSSELLPVNWLDEPYVPNIPGIHQIKGWPVLQGNATNLDSIPALAIIELDAQFLVAIDPSDTIQVDFGTAFPDIMFPEDATVHFNDGSSGIASVKWESGNYDPRSEGLYHINGQILLDAAIENPDSLQALIHVRVSAPPPVLVSLIPTDTIHVEYGAQFEDIEGLLPTEVPVLLDNGQTVLIPVSWEPGLYDPELTGVQILNGVLAVPPHLSDPDELEPELRVLVQNQYLVSMVRPDTVSVSFNTSFENIPLPTELSAKLNNGSDITLPVQWSSAGYTASIAGLYKFSGSFVDLGDILNPLFLQPEIHVLVEQERKTIISVFTDSLDVAYNTPLTGIALPVGSRVLLNDSTTLDIPVSNWIPGMYDPAVAGEYELEGLLSLPLLIDNPDSLNARLLINVASRYIISVDSLADLEVDFETAFEQLPLPSTGAVTFNDLSRGTADLIWSPDNYDPGQSGLVRLKAELIPDGLSLNPDSLQAAILVRIKEKARVLIQIDTTFMQVPYGSVFSEIQLPGKVSALFDNGTKDSLTVVWAEDNYNGLQQGVYEMYGLTALPADAVNPNSVQAVLRIDVAAQYISSVIQPADIRVVHGTLFSQLPLPGEVEVVFNDGTNGMIPVEWTADGFQSSAGEYVLKAEFVLDPSLQNPSMLYPEIKVVVEDLVPDINWVEALSDLEFAYGTTLQEILQILPARVLATYQTGDTVTLDLNWSTADFEFQKAGSYLFIGAPVLKIGTTNIDEHQANVNVRILQRNIISIDTLAAIRGTLLDDFGRLSLPTDVFVTYNDNSRDSLALTWDDTNYDPSTLTVQTIRGSLVLPDDATNTLGLQPEIMIQLSKTIVAVEPLTKRELTYGSPVSDLALPAKVKVTYNDQTEKLLDVQWDESIYSSASAGTLSLYAELPLEANVLNPDSIRASLEILILKAELLVTAEHKIRYTTEQSPELTLTYEGFVNGEDAGSLERIPTVSTTALPASPAGQYPIEVKEGVSANYEITYVNGILNVRDTVPDALPDSGPLGVFQIADYLVLLKELPSEARSQPFTIAALNAVSRLNDKNPPYSIRDWYSYGPVKGMPDLVTFGIRNKTSSSVNTGGFIHSDGGQTITERGICWSTSENPGITDNKIVAGTGTGSYPVTINGLIPGTYYIRAYAQNAAGVSYGNEVTLIIR